MVWEDDATDALREAGINLVIHLPDSIVQPLIDNVEESDDFETIRVTREEAGVAMASGAWMGGRKAALICQSSGLVNTFNALGSHVVPHGLPFIGFVTRRGELGDHNLAQVPAGYGLPRMLDDMGVRNTVLDESRDVKTCVEMAIDTAFSAQDPYLLLLDRPLTGGKE